MLTLLKTNIGRLRILGFLEGISLLFLIFICMPVKYALDNPVWVEVVGPIHGALFVLYVVLTLSSSAQYKWKFGQTIALIVASFIPFGTFYTDKKYLAKAQEA